MAKKTKKQLDIEARNKVRFLMFNKFRKFIDGTIFLPEPAKVYIRAQYVLCSNRLMSKYGASISLEEWPEAKDINDELKEVQRQLEFQKIMSDKFEMAVYGYFQNLTWSFNPHAKIDPKDFED